MERDGDFASHVLANRHNRAILERWDRLNLPDAWLVAGCLFQTIWNLRCGRPAEAGIKDYDLFYFDADDRSEEGERRVQARGDAVLGDLGVVIEASKQVRVHLWYEAYFGRSYAPLRDSREAIDRFLVLETCVGSRPGEHYAPYGLEGLTEGTLSPNPAMHAPELFTRKAQSYIARWPWLRVAGEDATLR
jgi:hypothetical protein